MPNTPAENDHNPWDADSAIASLVRDAPQAIVALDIDGRIVAANRAAADLAEMPEVQLHGRDLSELLGTGFTARVASAAETLTDNEPMSFATTVNSRHGAIMPVQVMILPERTGHHEIAAYVVLTPTGASARAPETVEPVVFIDGDIEAIFNSSATAILFFDLNGRIFRTNPALQQMLAHDADTLRGMNVLDLVHESDRRPPGADGNDPFSDLVAGRRNHYEALRRYIHRDGHLIWAQVTVSVVRDEAGEILYFISIMQDVTEMKLREDVAVIANETADSFNEGLQAIAEELAVQLGFQAAHVLLVQEETKRVLPTGIWYQERPGMLPNFCALTAATTFSPGSGHVGRVFSSHVATLDQDLQASSDSLRIAAAIDDGLHTGLFVPMIIHGDVVGVIEFYSTADRDVDPGLLDTLTRIAPQLGWFVERERSKETLRRKSAALERSNRDLDRFASVASHDLQEPLRAIGRCAHLLGERYGDELGDAGQLLHFITDGVQRMESMIADLLRYSRISTQAAEFTLVDLNDVVEDVLQDLAVAIDENDATVERAELPTVRGNDAQLHQVFQNLISNALKYRAEAPPRIRIDVGARGAAWLFAVKDNGIGIDPAYHEQIFDIFRRLHGRTQYTGTGIGLAIVKRIIEQHQGRLWVESEEGRGAAFFFTLPIPGGDGATHGNTATLEDRAAR